MRGEQEVGIQRRDRYTKTIESAIADSEVTAYLVVSPSHAAPPESAPLPPFGREVRIHIVYEKRQQLCPVPGLRWRSLPVARLPYSNRGFARPWVVRG